MTVKKANREDAMSRGARGEDGFRRADLDPSQRSVEDLLRLRDAIAEAARRKVDPAGTGFDATMSDEGGGLTDDGEFTHWWDWIEQIVQVISEGSTRIGLGIVAAGAAIASGLMYNAGERAAFAGPTLIVAAVFGAWFAISAAVAVVRRR
jgi:hypothetical protein